MYLPELPDPVLDDLAGLLADGEEPGREGLRELRPDLASVEVNAALDEVDMPEPQRDQGGIAGAGQEQGGNDRAVPAIERGQGRHRAQNVFDLLRRRVRLPPPRLGLAGELLGGAEVGGVGMTDARLVAWLICKPAEEPLELAERPVDRRGREGLPGALVPRALEMPLEPAGLFHVEALEAPASRIAVEQIDGGSGLVDGGVGQTLRVLQPDEVVPLDPEVLRRAL